MKISEVVLPILTVCIVVILWEGLVRLLSIPIFLFPAPSDILKSLVELLPVLWGHVLATLITVLSGFFLSFGVALPLGVIIAINKIASRSIYPILVFINAVPVVAISPIIVVMFGAGLEARLFITFFVAFFPITVAVISGIMDTPRSYLDLSRTVGNSFFREIYSIRLPHAAPFIFAGAKMGVSLSVIGAIVAEFITSNRGLGYLIMNNTTNFDLPRAMAAVIVLAITSVFFYQLVQQIQKRLFAWSL